MCVGSCVVNCFETSGAFNSAQPAFRIVSRRGVYRNALILLATFSGREPNASFRSETALDTLADFLSTEFPRIAVVFGNSNFFD